MTAEQFTQFILTRHRESGGKISIESLVRKYIKRMLNFWNEDTLKIIAREISTRV
jgi:hypothetical protein